MKLSQREAIDQQIRIGRGRPVGRRCRDGDVVTELPRLNGERQRDRADAQNDQRRMRQHRFDEHVHGAFTRAHVLGEAHAVAVFAGFDAELGEKIFRLH